MINKIKKPLVKDLRSKTNSIQGKEIEMYVPGEPLKKSSTNKTASGSAQYGKSKTKRSSAIILNILCFVLGASASAAVCLLFILFIK
jgi:hypothetical protein